MTFPVNPADGDTHTEFNNIYVYDESNGVWQLSRPTGTLTIEAPADNSLVATTEDLPASTVSGTIKYVSSNNSVYIWTGSSWNSVTTVNESPTAITGADSYYDLAVDGSDLVLTLISSDPEEIPLTWSYQTVGLATQATITQSENVITITPSTSELDAGDFQLTISASDTINLATKQVDLSLAFATIPNSKDTIFLINHAGGTNTLSDSSSNDFAITASNIYQCHTRGPFRPKTRTYVSQGGQGDAIRMPYNSTHELGSSDFTIEAWVYLHDLTVAHPIINSYNNWRFYITSKKLTFNYYNSIGTGVTITNSVATVTTERRWYHVAVSRQGSTIRFHQDGVVVGTYSISGSIVSSSTTTNYLTWPSWGSASVLTGGIEDIRVTLECLYPDGNSFIPSALPLPTFENTIIHLASPKYPYIVDLAGNNYMFTTTNPGTTASYPCGGNNNGLSRNDAYQKSLDNFNWDSVHLSGTTRLSTATSTVLTPGSSFTIETWVCNLDNGHAWSTIFWLTNSDFTEQIALQNWSIGADGGLGLRINGTWYEATGAKNYVGLDSSWAHVAVVRDAGIFKMYLNGKLVITINTLTSLVFNGSFLLYIGADTGSSAYLNGLISDLRYVNGTALYNSNFTPPNQRLTAIENTAFLLDTSDVILSDSSGTAGGLSPYDSNAFNNVATFSDSVTKFQDKSVVLASGSPVVLGAPANLFANTEWIRSDAISTAYGEWTIEYWYNPSADFFTTSPDKHLLDIPSGTSNWYLRFYKNSGNLKYSTGSGTTNVYTYPASSVFTEGTWSHIVVERYNNTVKFFVDGYDLGWPGITSVAYGSFPAIRIGPTVPAGYMEDFRFTARAVYQHNVTVPTGPLTI